MRIVSLSWARINPKKKIYNFLFFFPKFQCIEMQEIQGQ